MADLRPAVFLDRDGTINEEVDFLGRVEDLHLIPGVAEALGRLKQEGLVLVVVTNQSGVARGYFDLERVAEIHGALDGLLIDAGGPPVDAYYVCPHHVMGRVEPYARECDCRKPAPGLLLRAARDLGLDLQGSFMIGDRLRDVAAGLAAGTRGILVETGQQDGPPQGPHETPDFRARDLAEAVDWIFARLKDENS